MLPARIRSVRGLCCESCGKVHPVQLFRTDRIVEEKKLSHRVMKSLVS
jgi:hypothetical protein